MKENCLRILLLVLFIYVCKGREFGTVVTTNSGKLRGSIRTIQGSRVLQFVRIPFAQPPVGDLRFQKPRMVRPWKGIRDATNYGPACIQSTEDFNKFRLPNHQISEDCLFLNIYAPKQKASKYKKPFSVMIWLHGGSYMKGTGMMYDAAYLASQGDVIVVTLNYRLDVFGFLSTWDSAAPGNYGLWDQRLAIQWVKENIRCFGGNPSSITLFGQSAGGSSAGLQGISPINKGLIQRFISMSGVSMSPWAMIRNPLDNAVRVGKILGCRCGSKVEYVDTQALVDCLRRKDPLDLCRAAHEIWIPDPPTVDVGIRLAFGPVVDGEFIPDYPENLLADKDSSSYKLFNDLDVMAGYTDADAADLTIFLENSKQKVDFNVSEGIPYRFLCDTIAPQISDLHYGGRADIPKAICRRYELPPESPNDRATQGMRVIQALGDMTMGGGTAKTLDMHALKSPKRTYQYLFSHQPDYSFVPGYPGWVNGGKHTDDVPFVFGLDAHYPQKFPISGDERILSSTLMSYVTNFAKYGDPNQAGLPQWNPYTVDNKQYCNITADWTYFRSSQNLNIGRMTFWLHQCPPMESGPY